MIGDMQFAAVVLLTLMALALTMLLPRSVSERAVTNRSRWLMVAALVVLAAQFALQRVFGLRQMGVMQAALLNILMFIPTSALLSLAVLGLQRGGRLSLLERIIGVPTWAVAVAVTGWAVMTDGRPLLHPGERLLWAEVVASIVYGMMQLYYCVLHLKSISKLQSALEDYYDHDRAGLINWMRLSIVVLTLMATTVPLLIFASGWPLAIYGLLFLGGIFYLWFCFVRYIITNAMLLMQTAQESREQEEQEMQQMAAQQPAATEVSRQTEEAVERWIRERAYLTAGITSPMAAAEMGIPRYQLTAWVKASGHGSFTRWITSLRIDEAKRTLLEHPEWSNETTADHCGFSRAHFQRTFKKETGLSPSEFVSLRKGLST